MFTVTLSAASAQHGDGGLRDRGRDGDGAGSDYAAASGTLTFAPGETAKTDRRRRERRHAGRAERDLHGRPDHAANATIAGRDRDRTITNDDALPDADDR